MRTLKLLGMCPVLTYVMRQQKPMPGIEFGEKMLQWQGQSVCH